MKRPTDFSLTFGKRPWSWEREHCFTAAANCFDYFVCTTDARVSIVTWSGADILMDRQFVLRPERHSQRWLASVAAKFTDSVAQYYEPDERDPAQYFVRCTYGGIDRILRADGKPQRLNKLIDTIDRITESNEAQAAVPRVLADPPKQVGLAQQGWLIDPWKEAKDARGRTVIPGEIDRARGPRI